MPEDTQTGMIQAFLDNYEEDYVWLYHHLPGSVSSGKAFVPKWQSKEIGDLMDNEITGWEKHGTHRFSRRTGDPKGVEEDLAEKGSGWIHENR